MLLAFFNYYWLNKFKCGPGNGIELLAILSIMTFEMAHANADDLNVPFRSGFSLHLNIYIIVLYVNASRHSINSPGTEIMRREWLTKRNILCDDVVFGSLEL